jgi:GntR family transcriptional repressor for pyruvate dehydrogenase complex
MSFKKIVPKKISDEIYEQIKEMILEGKLHPKEKLPSERELSKKLGVSRASLREALNKLSAQGFIEQIPGEGTFVKTITNLNNATAISEFIEKEGSIFDLMDVRKILETWAAYSAALKSTDEEIENMAKYIEEMRYAKDYGKIGYVSDANFHNAISYATHNVLLIHIMNNIYEWIEKVSFEVRLRMYKDKDSHKDLFNQHENIFLAIKNRDALKAEEAMKIHMEYVERELRKIF